MTLADLSIKRPIFITCIVILSLAVGILSLFKLPVDLFPNVTFPVVVVTTPYRGAGPEEIETLVSKPLEEEYSSISGLKRLKSNNKEGVSVVIAEFYLETDVKYAEQQIRDHTSSAKIRLPKDIDEPVIRRVDPADQPILIVSLSADLDPGKLYDLADLKVKPKIEQVPQVGLVDIIGGRKREIQVELDRKKLKEYEISAGMVASRIGDAGQNIPAGKVDQTKQETIIRTVGDFANLDDIRKTIVNFVGNDVPVTVSQLGTVRDYYVDEKSRAAVNGKTSLLLFVFRQSGANTIKVADQVKDIIGDLNKQLENQPGKPSVKVVRDGAKPIRINVEDVRDTIFLGIILTIVVVYFFLGSGRSTLITGLALPNSLLGAFILMSAAGFSINIMTLLALSLAVGLLIDDAIVVRENIFRHVEMGADSITAAIAGTKEVTLAVVATSLTVIAVFAPIAFLQGMVGQFFREFGLTMCFAMAISLFDALTMAPMLSAYYAGSAHHGEPTTWFGRVIGIPLKIFNRFWASFENFYAHVLKFSLRRPILVLLGALVIFILSLAATAKVPKTFLPAQDNGEFTVDLDLPPGTSLDEMTVTAKKVDETIRANKEVLDSVMTIGDRDGLANVASYYVTLVEAKDRPGVNTSQLKERLRNQLQPFHAANPKVKDYDAVGGGQRPFNLDLTGQDLDKLEQIAQKVVAKLRNNPGLKDVDLSYRPGKPEFQVKVDLPRAERLGVASATIGNELRTLVDGITPAKFREHGDEYDVRVRLQPDQRNLMQDYGDTYVPNINGRMVKLSKVSTAVNAVGLSNVDRLDRGRYISVTADLTPGGPGMGGAINDVNALFRDEIKLPPGYRYFFEGQAENFKELLTNMVIAMGLGVLFVYLVLSSLYESFVTPFTIMLVLPLAACGAFFALAITGQSLDIFSMIGCIMLMGLATKNSILLVDYTQQKMAEGMSRAEALTEAGRTRLRPILMTSFALVAGMIPIAIGLNEASKQRVSLGIAVIGGILSSTALTLVVVPAAFSYIDRLRVWLAALMKRLFLPQTTETAHAPQDKPRKRKAKSETGDEGDLDLQPGV